MTAFTQAEKDLATGLYRGYADAIGRSIARWEHDEWKRGIPEVFVALYSHPFGVDVSVFTTEPEARKHLRAVSHDQCRQDAKIKRAVARRFGWAKWSDTLFIRLSEDALDALVDAWGDIASGEALWISRCVVEREFARRAWRQEAARADESVGERGTEHMDDHGDDQVNDQAETETEASAVCTAVTVAQCASDNTRLETKDPVRDRVREPVM
jgi:hypothetical protein